jgi:ATP-dependent RNA helicase RhlE
LKDIPTEVEITKTSYSEAQAMSLDMDWQKKREDPEFKGAFHEKKKKGASSGRRSQR